MAQTVSQKKFSLTISALCIGFLMIVGALIGVWAATTQNFKAGFNVNYTVGENVAAAVRTEYYIPGSGQAAEIVTTDENFEEVENENGYVKFNTTENTATKSVYIGDFALTPETPSIEFFFTVRNDLANGFIQAVVAKNYTVKNNIDVKTYYYNTDSFTSTNSATTVADSSWKTNTQVNNAVAEGYKMIKVVLSVDNQNKAAVCAGDISLTLNYSTTATNEANLSRDNFFAAMRAFPHSNNYQSVVFDYVQNNASYQTTGTDISVEGNNKIWTYAANNKVYVLSKDTIFLPQDCERLFASCDENELTGPFANCKQLDFINVDTSKVTTMSYMFGWLGNDTAYQSINGIENFNTSNVTNMSGMFDLCSSLTTLDLSSFDTSNVTTLAGMFAGCTSLKNINLTSFNTSKVTSMRSMFANGVGGVATTVLDLSSFDTSKVTDMMDMFYDCKNLQTIYVSDLWSTESVTNGWFMFQNCEKLVGAVAYSDIVLNVDDSGDENKTGAVMATTDGYLTLKTN